MIPVHFDCETSDPDDIFTLCILASHPKVDLKSITVTPGSSYQIALVKHVLKLLNKEIPIGAGNLKHSKECVSEFHWKWLGNLTPVENCLTASGVLNDTFTKFPNTILLTGGPLTNIGNFITDNSQIEILSWFCQGGFAGDNIVPKEFRLLKFDGKITCPTFNLNGNTKAALSLINSKQIKNIKFVSKNVCHGVRYDQIVHFKIQEYLNNYPGLKLIWEGMDLYLKRHSNGKLFHDPLAACAIINSDIITWKNIELYREKGEWGSKESINSNQQISINVNHELFFNTLVNKGI